MPSEGNLSFSLILIALMQINFATPARRTAKGGGENTDAKRNQKKLIVLVHSVATKYN